MTEGAKPKRLFKVAKEFNVTTQSIVDALAKNDHKVDNKPNSMISPEMYSILEQEYGEDKAKSQSHARAKSDYDSRRQTIRERGNEVVSIDEILTPQDEKTEEKAAPEDILTPETDDPVPPLEPVEEPAKKEEKPKPEAKEEKKEVKKEEKKEPAPKAEEEEKVEKKPKQEEKPEAEKKPAAKKTEEKKPEAEEAETTASDDENEEEEVPSEVIRGRAGKLSGTKVLGTIDVSSGDDKRKKAKKKRKKAGADAEDTGSQKVKKKPKSAPDSDDSSSKKRKKKKRIKKTAEKPQVKEKDVDEKLKETLSMMQGGKGKQRQRRRRQKRDEKAAQREQEEMIKQEESQILEVTEFITVSDLAELLDVNPTQIITICMNLGLMVTINQRLEANIIELIADEFDRDIKFVDADEVIEEIIDEEEDDEADLVPRAPVVTVMGHVDHGKTSLLDYIRHTRVVEGEAGGITQHIGAYAVELPDGRKISFLDTPGHEAFTAMRARGAQVTDIVILVVAADDSVMPQTIEAINHAQAAGVSIVVAINKIDKEDANPDKIKQQLSEHNVLVEEWGGKVQSAEVSAKKGQGVDELLEKVLIEAELMDLKANPDRRAVGIVLETKLDRGKGVVANVLVERGTLKIGDTFVAGNQYGRVRAMENELGQRIEEAGPSTPVQMTGFDGSPQAGDKLNVTEDEKTAKEIAIKRQQIKREQELRKVKHMSLDDIARRMSAGEVSELNIIIKGDVDGSIEALSGSLQKLSTDEVKVNIIHTGVGAISESDILLATASNAIIIGFQVRPSANARKLAEKEQIDIRLFSIIYEAVDVVRDALEGLLTPEISEKIVASVDVRDTFKVPGVGTIAGCYVTEGKITRNTRVRLIRDGIVIFTGEISSLKRFKDDVREVASGYECGIGIHNYNDIKVGDVIEGFEIEETKRKLVVEN